MGWMGITGKPKTKPTTTATASDTWPGMSLLVLFPADPTTPTTTLLKRTNSHSNSILTKAQSTLSLCLLFLFLTLLLFALSTFEPTPTPTPTPSRFLKPPPKPNELPLFALRGMGKLHLRGTFAMPDLIVCHVSEDTPQDDFKLFLRLLLRSGTLSRSDVVFLFPSSNSLSLKFQPLISQELHSFFKLLQYYYYYYKEEENGSNTSSLLDFDVARFLRKKKKDGRGPLWGKKVRVFNHVIMKKNNNSSSKRRTGGFNENSTESTRPSYGSVVSFEVSELDPENSLAGFLDHVPMSLRRWACYPLLLGRVRRNFKHLALVDVRSLIVTGEPLARVRKLNPESVCVFRRNSEKTRSQPRVDSAFLMGGARGIRRLSNLMLTEIVRVATQHRKRNTVSELDVLSQLVGNRHVLKNVELVESAESLPELSSLTGLSSSSREFHNNHWSIIRRGNGNIREINNSVIMKRICALELDSSVYRDC